MQLQEIQNLIYEIRDQKVMLDFDLAELYDVETRALKQAVKRNIARFPSDFMFQLTKKEWLEVITKCDNLPENIKFSPTPPSAFTEQGVSMLSAVLNSKKAINVSICIVRAFVLLRQYALNYTELKQQIKNLEKEMNHKFKDVYEALNFLLNRNKLETEQKERKQIGYK